MNFFALLHKRLAIGVTQGLILYLLWHAVASKVWPATEGMLFSPLILAATVVPALALLALGGVRRRTLVAWAVLATALLMGLAAYDIARRSGLDENYSLLHAYNTNLPSFSLCFCVLIGFFIAQSLVIAGDAERRWIASYPLYFDVAWKLAVQLSFITVFVSLFWLVLWTGSSLFELIKISFFKELFQHDWFAIPVTAVATAYAAHVTDIRVNLIRGLRTLKLATLSWLLPIMAGFVAAFMVTLPFQGIAVLWATHHTSQIMLGAMAWLILLVNAVYQDGTVEHQPGRLLRASARLGAGLLLPLWLMGAYALFVRSHALGWTVNMIEVAACFAVAAIYAGGYLVAAFKPQPWLKTLEKTNIYAAFSVLVVLLVLLTPVADPARLAVDSQMARLRSGEITFDKFDYRYLKQNGASYGMNALRVLQAEAKTSTNPDEVAAQAKIEDALNNKFSIMPRPAPTANDITKSITVYPPGRTLPENFARQDWSKRSTDGLMPPCLLNPANRCDAFLIDGDNGAPPQILLVGEVGYSQGVLFRPENDGWKIVGFLNGQINCKGMRDALHAGHFKLTTTVDPSLEINGMHIEIFHNTACL